MVNMRLFENVVFGMTKKMIKVVANTAVVMFSVVRKSKKKARAASY